MDKHDERHTGEEQESLAGELAPKCGLCGERVQTEFFRMHGLPICSTCAETARRRSRTGGSARRVAIYGGVTAAGLALLWFLVTVATGRPLSSLAVAAGIAIGLAVRHGSGGRGGFRLQLTAMLLVYATFVVRHVPAVFGGIADAIKKDHAARIESQDKTEQARTTSSEHTPAEIAPASTAEDNAHPAAAGARTSLLATLEAYFVFTAIAWAVVIASPFLPGTSGTLTLLSLFIGMALAFGLNLRTQPQGPFKV